MAYYPRMTYESDLIRAQIQEAGLSQRGAARVLEIDERTMRRYCAGESPVPTSVTIALRLLVLLHKNKQTIRVIERNPTLAYELIEGGSVNISEQEKNRLKEINSRLKGQVKKLVRKR